MTRTLTISQLGNQGDGIVNSNNGDIFIPYALPGEVVEANINGNRGEIVRLIKKHRDRTDPVCPHFGVCGGCSMQHVKPQLYLDWKYKLVEEPIFRQNITTKILPVIPISKGTRRRARFSFRQGKHGLEFGFYKRKSRQILSLKQCPLLHPQLEQHLLNGDYLKLANTLTTSQTEAHMSVTLGKNGVSIAVNGKNIKDTNRFTQTFLQATQPFWKVCINQEDTTTIADDTLVNDCFELTIPPGAFCQSAAAAEQALVNHVIPFLKEAKTCTDLFCGIGTFTLHLAKFANVLAVEGHDQALRALRTSAAHAQGIKPIQTLCRDLNLHPLSAHELNAHDGVLINPPRNGAKAQCLELAKSSVKRIAFISCSPTHFAKDARILINGGYKLLNVQPVDQFLYSHHIELAAHFERQS